MPELKTPPHSIDAEQSVIGGLLLDNDAWMHISDKINAHDFYRHDHRIIYNAIQEMIDANQACDVLTLSEHLKNQDLLEQAGGLTYLAAVVKNTPSAANIKAYADIVRERSVLRQLIQVGSEITEEGFNPQGKKVEELIESAEQKVFEISDKGAAAQSDFVAISTLIERNVDRLEQLYNNSEGFLGIPTGYTELDKLIPSGMQAGELIIIAARPSMGKTSFAMNIVENFIGAELQQLKATEKAKQGIAVFSLEMPAEAISLRMLSSISKVDQTRIRTGKLEVEDWERLTFNIKFLNRACLFIDDTPGLSPTEMRSRVRRLKRENDISLIVVDYLQLMQIHGKTENRVNEISEISRGLKALAKEMEVPVIALSQLNRSVEQRPNKRPVMSDLRESGAIEQDADVILFIYRDEVYNEESENKGSAEIIIGKQRNGPLGTARLAFLKQFTRFENLAHSEYEI